MMLLPRQFMMSNSGRCNIILTTCMMQWQTFLLLLLLLDCADGRHNNNNNNNNINRALPRYRTTTTLQQTIDVKDKILELQCYAKCERNGGATSGIGSGQFRTVADLKLCCDECKVETMKLPRRGFCPSMQNVIFQNISPLQKLSCLDNCHNDFDCPEVQRCCESSCGPVCMDAIGVREDSLLPPIPKILKYKLPRGHKVEITIQSSANSTYYCHVEARYHIGLMFSPRKLGTWQWQPVEKIAEISDSRSKRTDIAFNLRPGRWYQVRVAAINAYGFRGYSEPSKAFTLTNHPKPPKSPADLKVVSNHFDGRYYAAKIVWCPSKSNLPIEKYKIIWSLYVKSKDESLISNEAYVKDSHQFEIMKLLPDSSYYIQVQAMSISGSRRLKSEKFSILYNTTSALSLYAPLKCSGSGSGSAHQFDSPPEYNEITSISTTTREETARPTNAAKEEDEPSITTTPQPLATTYSVRFRLNRKFGLIVQISGFHPYKEKVYELCPKETNCEQREYSAIRAKKDSLEFSKLKYNTTYMLKAYQLNAATLTSAAAASSDVDSSNSGAFIFTTPKCENFRKRFPKMQIKC